MFRILIYISLILSVQKDLLSQEYWISQTSPTNKDLKVCFFTDTLNGWIGGDSGLILHTTNNGAGWISQNSGVSGGINSIYFINSNTGYALSLEFDNAPPNYYGTRILSTTDGGNLWNNYLYPDTGLFLNTVYFWDSNNGYLGGSGGKLFYTNNSGTNWTLAAIDSGLNLGFPVLEIMFYDSTTGYAVGGAFDIAGVIWQTTNGGTSWITKIIGPEPMHDLYVFDALNVIGVGGDFEYGVGKVNTSTGGAVWDYTELGVFGIANTIEFRTESEAWVSLGIIDSFLVSTDSGNSWRQEVSPNSTNIYDISFSSSTNGWAVGLEGALLKFNSKSVGINNDALNMPESITLYQNFPNPFNPTTNLSFEISNLPDRNSNVNAQYSSGVGFISLKIFDVLGKEVTTLINQNKPAGSHQVMFDGSNLSSGIYFYSLFVNGILSDSKRMLLLR